MAIIKTTINNLIYYNKKKLIIFILMIENFNFKIKYINIDIISTNLYYPVYYLKTT